MHNFKKMISGYAMLFREFRNPDREKKPFDRSLFMEPFHLLTHPIATYNDMKFEGRSSMLVANLLMVLFVIQQLLTQMCSGYLFNPALEEEFNALPILAGSIGLVAVWTVCNWAMCTLLDGEGKMREIWIAMCYALLPAILLGFVGILLSNVLTQDEAIIYSVTTSIGTGWSLLLAFFGMMVVHQYTVKKTILSTLFTVICIVILAFLVLLLFSILQQLFGFISNISQELVFR